MVKTEIIENNKFKKIFIDVPKTVNHEFIKSLKIRIVENTTHPWMFWYGMLENYVMNHGDCFVL